ncbi:MAG: porin family protein [Chitinophaga sp.]
MVKILHNNLFRKSLLAVCSLLVFSMAAQAQRTFSRSMSEKTGRKMRLGFKLDPGASFLKAQDNGVERNSGRFYFSYGILADFLLDESGNYAIGSGVQISHMGSVMQYEPTYGLDDYDVSSSEYDIRLQYIEVPVTLKLRTDTDRGVGVWGQFGGFAGFPIRARANVISGQQKFDKVNIFKDVNPLIAGLVLGGGIDYPLTETLTGVVGFIYQNNFIDVTRNSKWDDGRMNTNNFVLRLGVYF